MKRHLLLLAGVMACAVAALVLVSSSKATSASPAAAVKAFLINRTLERNGFEACNYLSSSEQRAISAAGQGQSCRQAIDAGSAQLQVGRTTVTSLGQVKRLSTTESVDGNRASVWLADGSARVKFELVKADASEKQEFQAPNTDWRISAGPGLAAPLSRSAHRAAAVSRLPKS